MVSSCLNSLKGKFQQPYPNRLGTLYTYLQDLLDFTPFLCEGRRQGIKPVTGLWGLPVVGDNSPGETILEVRSIESVVDLFVYQFHHCQSTTFTTEQFDNFPSKSNSPYPSMPHFKITTQGVYNILNEGNSNKSPGPDKLHPYALKATEAEISPMLTHTFQQSLSYSRLPTQWKHAYVTPVYKKGDKSDPKNYRPISLTSVI